MSHDVEACDAWYREWRAQVIAGGGSPNFGLAQVAACDARKPLEERIDLLEKVLTEIMAMSEPAGYWERSKAQIRDVARRALNPANGL